MSKMAPRSTVMYGSPPHSGNNSAVVNVTPPRSQRYAIYPDSHLASAGQQHHLHHLAASSAIPIQSAANLILNHHAHHSAHSLQHHHLHGSPNASMYLDPFRDDQQLANGDHRANDAAGIAAEIMNAAPISDSHRPGKGALSSGGLRSSSKKQPPPSAASVNGFGDENRPELSGWDQLEITGGVRNMSKSLFMMTHLTALYTGNNMISIIPPEIAQLRNLQILDLSYNRIRMLPREIGQLLQLRQLYLQNNFIRTLPFEMGRLYKLTRLNLDGNPLQSQICEMYQELGLEKFLQYLLNSLDERTAEPPTRNLLPVFQPISLPRNPSIALSVMCYNVLCGQYCNRTQYGYCPDWALSWDYRRKGIMAEIRRLNADITCLQEVETEQYYNFFVPELKLDGKEGCFVPKSRAKTMGTTERNHVDGCAIFYDASKFEFIESFTVEFSHLAMSYAHSDGTSTEASENMLNRVMPKDNVGLVALLRVQPSAMPQNGQSSDEPQRFHYILVVNAHVHWDPEFCDVKLIQCIMLSSKLREIASDVSLRYYGLSKPDPQAVPIIFTGDMNSTPDSGVYEFFMNGNISFEHDDFKGIRYKQCIARYSSGTKEEELISHGLHLANSYHTVPMDHTNFTLDFKGVIDYIMYSRNHFNCTSVLQPLDRSWLEANQILGFPHPHVPSDHVPLYAQFQLFTHSILSVPRQAATGGEGVEFVNGGHLNDQGSVLMAKN